jgi:biofilm PGA synthesis N-glycosyltransferase PgaC
MVQLWLMKIGLPVGITSTFWFLMGLLRALTEQIQKGKPKKKPQGWQKVTTKDIAVIIAAHNEEKVIRKCIQAIKHSIDPNQIHVASDGSTDNTLMEVKKEGCRVVGIAPGVGKAKALVHLIESYKIYDNYKFVMIVDADTKVDKHYITLAIPWLEDPKIAVVFPTARIKWQQHLIPTWKYYIISYRERLDRILQFFLVYGQTWKYTNASFVAPGFCTIYRSSVLRQLRIDTPGLLIEDFNLAFQLHKKKLGLIHFQPSFIGWDQHPDNLRDYWKQVRRWNIGFFQTIVANGYWTSFFWWTMAAFSIEVAVHAMFILVLPLVIILNISMHLPDTLPFAANLAHILSPYLPFITYTYFELFLAVFWFDYMMTIVFGIMGRKPQFLFYGIFFYFMHYVTALILLTSFIPGFFSKSNGIWTSPKRHTLNG